MTTLIKSSHGADPRRVRSCIWFGQCDCDGAVLPAGNLFRCPKGFDQLITQKHSWITPFAERDRSPHFLQEDESFEDCCTTAFSDAGVEQRAHIDMMCSFWKFVRYLLSFVPIEIAGISACDERLLMGETQELVVEISWIKIDHRIIPLITRRRYPRATIECVRLDTSARLDCLACSRGRPSTARLRRQSTGLA